MAGRARTLIAKFHRLAQKQGLATLPSDSRDNMGRVGQGGAGPRISQITYLMSKRNYVCFSDFQDNALALLSGRVNVSYVNAPTHAAT